MAKLRQFFQRMIAVADRVCTQCEDVISEGETYFKAKNTDIWCGSCVDYERQKE